MSILVRFTPTNLTRDLYDEVVRRLERPATLRLRAWRPRCLRRERRPASAQRASRDHFEAFAQRLIPQLGEIEIELARDPAVFEVHNVASP